MVRGAHVSRAARGLRLRFWR